MRGVLLLAVLGAALAAQGVPPAAEAALARADALGALAIVRRAAARTSDPGRLVPLLRYEGYLLVLLKRESEAEAVFRRLLRLAPQDPYGLLELAKRCHARGAFREARRFYRRLLALRPGDRGAREGLRRLAEAERTYRRTRGQVAAAWRRVYLALLGAAFYGLLGLGLARRLLA